MINKKLKLFLITLFPFIFSINAFAGKITDSSGNLVYQFMVDNASMVDAYYNIFNAMASFFQSNDYLELLKVVFLLGGMTVFFTGVMKVYQGGDAKGSMGDFLKYLLLGTALLTIIFSHKTSMIIQTNNLPSFCVSGTSSSESIIASDPSTGVVVGNIPEVLAWTFSMINEVGRETTRLATMGFTAVDADLTTYTSRSDYASYLQGIGTVLTMKLTDLTAQYDYTDNTTLFQGLEAIMRDCVAAPAANEGDLGSVVLAGFNNTGNLKQTLTDYFSNGDVNVYLNPSGADSTQYTTGFTSGGKLPGQLLTEVNGKIYQCSQVWTNVNSILTDIFNGDQLVCSRNLKDYWNPETMAIFTGDPTVTGSIQGKNIALNAALANEVTDSKYNIAPGEISYAGGKSTAEFVHSSLGTGYYMAQMLPYLQMGMRAVLYAFFPFVFIIVLLPGGIKVLISYLQSLIWIELWSPTAAVLDMFISLMATDKFRDMYQENGFNPTNGLQAFSDSAMLASVAGYLYASVPALTWLILKGSGHMLGNISGAIGARMSANVQSDSILRDKAAQSNYKKNNQERLSRGEQAVSLAEQDRLVAQAAAWEAAGAADQRIQNMDKLFLAGSGKELSSITKNSAMGEEFKKDKANVTALESSTKEEIRTTTQEQKTTGNLQKDSNGNYVINDSNVSEIASSQGTNKGFDKLSNKEKIGALLAYTGGDVNKAAEVMGRDKFEKIVQSMKDEELQAVMHNLDPNSKEQMRFMRPGQAQTAATEQVIKEEKDQNKHKQLGLYADVDPKTGNFKRDEKGNIELKGNTKQTLRNIAQATATKEVVENLTQQEMKNTFTNAERVDSNLTQNSKQIGLAQATPEQLATSLSVIANTPGHKDSAKAQQILTGLGSKDAGTRNRALSQAAGLESLQGVMGAMYSNISNDTKAKTLENNNFSASDSGDLAAAKQLTDIKAGSVSFGQLNESETGKAALLSAGEQLQNEGILNNHLDSNGKLTEQGQKIVAERAVENLKAVSTAWNAQSDNLKVKNLEEFTTVENNARGQAVTQTVNAETGRLIEKTVGMNAMIAGNIAGEAVKITRIAENGVKSYSAANKRFKNSKVFKNMQNKTNEYVSKISADRVQNLNNLIMTMGIR